LTYFQSSWKSKGFCSLSIRSNIIFCFSIIIKVIGKLHLGFYECWAHHCIIFCHSDHFVHLGIKYDDASLKCYYRSQYRDLIVELCYFSCHYKCVFFIWILTEMKLIFWAILRLRLEIFWISISVLHFIIKSSRSTYDNVITTINSTADSFWKRLFSFQWSSPTSHLSVPNAFFQMTEHP
jgi:hypothetical protein